MTTIKPMVSENTHPPQKTPPITNKTPPKPEDYITVDEYLLKGTNTAIICIDFFDGLHNHNPHDPTTLRIRPDTISYAVFKNNAAVASPQILDASACLVYADRDNKIIYIKDKDGDEPLITVPYTTNETVFET